jgi:hypothetical protein
MCVIGLRSPSISRLRTRGTIQVRAHTNVVDHTNVGTLVCRLIRAGERRRKMGDLIEGTIWLPVLPTRGDILERDDPSKKTSGFRYVVLGTMFTATDASQTGELPEDPSVEINILVRPLPLSLFWPTRDEIEAALAEFH